MQQQAPRPGPAPTGLGSGWGHKNFFIFQPAIKHRLTHRQNGQMVFHFWSHAAKLRSMTFKSLPLTVREIRATEATLERIYNAAYLGLKDDALALAAGLLPVEYKRLKELDQTAQIAELKGRADSERENSQHLLNAARAGDAKAALAILQHTHGWVAKQAISVEVDQRISVIDALRAAESRVIEGQVVTPALEVSRESTPPLKRYQATQEAA